MSRGLRLFQELESWREISQGMCLMDDFNVPRLGSVQLVSVPRTASRDRLRQAVDAPK